jgi:hypothetical protein
MNTWTDSGISDAGLVGAMLALGLDAAPARDAGPARSAAPVGIAPAVAAVRSLGSAPGDVPAGRGRFPAPERPSVRPPSSFPPPPMPEPKLASDDLSGWTDGFLAGGSPLTAPASWDEPSASSVEPDDRSAPQSAELTSMLDRLLEPGRAPRMSTPAVSAPSVPAPVVSAPSMPAPGAAAPLEARPAHPIRPDGPSTPPVSGGLGSGPLDGPLDVDELEPAQLDFEVAPLDPDTRLEPASLEPTMLEPTSLDTGGRPADEPSLAELAGFDRPGLGPVVLGSLGLESMDLDASAFAPSPEFPPPTEPAAPAAPEPTAGPVSEPLSEAEENRPDGAGGAHRRADAAVEPRHRRNDMSPLSSLDDSPLYSTLSPRQD